MRELVGTPLTVRTTSLPEDDPTRRRPDISLARERLGWAPTVPLEVGLERTIRWFREVLDA